MLIVVALMKFVYVTLRYPVYVLCIVMILATTSVFMFVLIDYQLPAVMQKTFPCTPESAECPASVQCAFTGRADKRAILWAMACCSAATITLCVGYLATHAGQACGLCGDRDDTEKARADHRSGEAERVSRRAWREGGDSRRQGSGDSRREGREADARRPAPRRDVGVGIEGCSCQLDGANCCCRDMTCDCYDNRHCPCYFPDTDTGLHSLACREESDGKLLRGDTEVMEEGKEWRAHEERRVMRQPRRTGPQRSRASPGVGGMRRV
uniref:Uncharacterized protein n=1 Tax=Sphaerodactylus townsendi TaxID=933632 RepID=A0ACB8EVY9_9SAUR